MEIPISKIQCDIIGRTNKDVTELSRNLTAFGQLEPVLVEGPDENGDFFLIHGYRRYLAMLENKSKFNKIKCTVNSGITSQENRNALRLILISNGKKTTGLDQQLVYEEIKNNENCTALIPKSKKRRMEKGNQVPQEDRIKYEIKRRSQDALALIYELKELGHYRSQLLEMLYQGKITTIHADAIKRVVSHSRYDNLNLNQKITVIEKARKTAKFTNNEAGFLIFEEMMKQNPQKENVGNWIEYICDEMERISELIHEDLQLLTTEIQKRKLRKSLQHLTNRLDWVFIKEQYNRKEEKTENTDDLKRERSKHKDENKIKKQTIIMEKRNGNKLTFYFN
ncbi:ParB-like nuclease family protein [Cytobacillus oceanisediminis]|uniref:ParB-like nuclease family protein n=1 Tax=Cytobacillus oceanisediminis TaxID=665099 RepID=A0A2V2ZRL3_9BACI|nr:ParB N-terminal domain-containing protein [Cytobacillus oceanisediminis]PWW26637.1 ParB-like nuclease family protein [Cytobacillus oceanisediminis]